MYPILIYSNKLILLKYTIINSIIKNVINSNDHVLLYILSQNPYLSENNITPLLYSISH